ncbi:hypothetical protein F2P81_024769 [Scophthalmus maximus]|uniref:Uncharacterized protein n=1 Tax=Scophthalmus maximus TaxID=52904 RepID=A0A6A4RRX2_SCOMX|nr:hypothetical protein F2P81_024769 [Scophthalmus maximus]
MSSTDIPLKRAVEEDTPLVECDMLSHRLCWIMFIQGMIRDCVTANAEERVRVVAARRGEPLAEPRWRTGTTPTTTRCSPLLPLGGALVGTVNPGGDPLMEGAESEDSCPPSDPGSPAIVVVVVVVFELLHRRCFSAKGSVHSVDTWPEV